MRKCTQGCLLESTRILMVDGSKKEIQNLRIGDILRFIKSRKHLAWL